MKLVTENVTDLVEAPEKQKFIGNFYNQEEIGKLLEIIEGTSIEAPVMFAIYYGLRRSEILGIKWSAIDLVNKALPVRHKIVPFSDNGKYTLNKSDKLKNKASYRTMPIDDFLCDYLAELRRKQEENKKFAGNVYDNTHSEYVCVNELGKLLLPNYVTKKFKELLEDKGLRVIRLHDLRHSCASLLLHLGYNMNDVQEWLGHGDIGTTMNIYAHIEASRKTSMLDGIDNAVRRV
jgi:integrase